MAEQVELKIKLVFVSLSWEFIVKFEVVFCSVDWWKQAVLFSFKGAVAQVAKNCNVVVRIESQEVT